MPFQFRQRVDWSVVPWCTYTDPEVYVGLGEEEARRKNIGYDLFAGPLEDIDRAVVESEELGFAKILAAKSSAKFSARPSSPHTRAICCTNSCSR